MVISASVFPPILTKGINMEPDTSSSKRERKHRSKEDKHKRHEDSDDHHRKHKKRRRHEDDDEGSRHHGKHKHSRKDKESKRDAQGENKMTIVDDDPNDKDLWVEKDIGMDGERVSHYQLLFTISRHLLLDY